MSKIVARLGALTLMCVLSCTTFGAWAAATPTQTNLANFHLSHGASCQTCHGQGSPAPGARVAKATCKGCHDPQKLRQQTAHVSPNPHYTHLGDVNCTDCHKGHQKGVLMCNSCHRFSLQVPH